MLSKIKTILTPILIISFVFIISGCGPANTNYKVNLEIWGVFDDSDAMSQAIAQYKLINPYVGDIKYRKLTIDSYKKDLIDAMASGKGPDIFYMQNNWLPSFADKTEPAPTYLLGEQEFRANFVDVAASDFLKDGKIYGVPLSVDSLALYYNKDLFNAEGITAPPATWADFNIDVQRLTKFNNSGQFIQSGAAMGTAYNINRSTDILGLLMLQQGVQMTDSQKTMATFNQTVNVGPDAVRGGENALNYYTQFARPGQTFCWTPNMHYSIDAFYEGTVAMMLNYSWQYPTIQSKNSKLNFGVVAVPQIGTGTPVNFANYWGLAVTKNKDITAANQNTSNQLVPTTNDMRIHEAWQFLRYLTLRNSGKITLMNAISKTMKDFPVAYDPASQFLDITKQPAARRDIIDKQKMDPVLGPFAYGNLIARSWYEKDPDAIEGILADMINSVNLGKSSSYDALNLAANRVSQLMR